MSFVRNKLYSKEYIGLDIDYNTTFSTDRKLEFHLYPTEAYTQVDKHQFAGNLQLIRVTGTLNGGASDNITMCVYKNADGTRMVVEPTEAVLVPDISGGKFSAMFLIDAVWVAEDDELYIFIKTQNHVFTLNELEITWRNS